MDSKYVYMKNQEIITSREVLKELGLKNIKTLTRWYNEYLLIPKPKIITHPGGRGKIACWDREILPLLKLIKSKFDQGLTSQEIKYFLQTKKTLELRFSDTNTAPESFGFDIDNSAEKYATLKYKLENIIEKSDFNKKLKNRIYEYLFISGVYLEASLLITAGINPVLLIFNNEIKLYPDFLINTILSENNIKGIVHIVPLADYYKQYFDGILKNSKCEYVTTNSKNSVIQIDGSGRITEIPFKRADNWLGFELLFEHSTIINGGKNNG